jgi:hypothetical protein
LPIKQKCRGLGVPEQSCSITSLSTVSSTGDYSKVAVVFGRRKIGYY